MLPSLLGHSKAMIPLVCAVCLLLFLLLTPLSLRFLLDTTPLGGWGRMRLFWGPVPVFSRPLRISLLEFPCLTVQMGKRPVSLSKLLRPRPGMFMPPVRFESIEGTVYVGVEEEGAAAVLLLGGVWALLKALGAAVFERAAFRPVPCFQMNCGRIKLEGILSLHPGETLLVYLKEKRSEHADR